MPWSLAGNEEIDNDANNSPVTVAGSLFASIYLQLVMLPLVLLIIQMLTRAKGQSVGLLQSPAMLSACKLAVRWSLLQGYWPLWHTDRGKAEEEKCDDTSSRKQVRIYQAWTKAFVFSFVLACHIFTSTWGSCWMLQTPAQLNGAELNFIWQLGMGDGAV